MIIIISNDKEFMSNFLLHFPAKPEDSEQQMCSVGGITILNTLYIHSTIQEAFAFETLPQYY